MKPRNVQAWIRSALVGLLVTPALAHGMSLVYDATKYPEQDGWTAVGNTEEPDVYTRSIGGGIFSINATASGVATVVYERYVSLEAAHANYEWRSATSNDDGYSFLALVTRDGSALSNAVISWRATELVAYFFGGTGETTGFVREPLLPGQPHTFSLQSQGPSYGLYVDGLLRGSGELIVPADSQVQLQFGFVKNFNDIPTTSDWYYVHASDVPEPSSLAACGTFLWFAFIKRRRSIG